MKYNSAGRPMLDEDFPATYLPIAYERPNEKNPGFSSMSSVIFKISND
jgi:hypothetical protein